MTAAATAAQTLSRTTCVVGCKLQSGLIMELGKAGDKNYQRFVARGPNGKDVSSVIGGYGLTEGIPSDFMKSWLKKNEELKFVKTGLIFIHNSMEDAKAHAQDFAELKTGLEPLDPVKDAPKDSKGNPVITKAS